MLEIVDTVFGGVARAGVASRRRRSPTRVSRIGEYGEIVVWPIARPIATDPPAPWQPPTVRELAAAPEARLAESIADEIGQLLSTAGTRQRGEARRIGPGDIMILVRNRTKFMDLMVRALKRRAIPVVGVDRMTLLDQIAVMDLIAFCRFLLLPDDDLNLAALLKSPLVGVTEEELFTICTDREWQERVAARAGARRHHAGARSARATCWSRSSIAPASRRRTSSCPNCWRRRAGGGGSMRGWATNAARRSTNSSTSPSPTKRATRPTCRTCWPGWSRASCR